MTANDVETAAKVAGMLLPQTIASADGVLSAVMNVFNNILCYPLKKANLTFQYKLEQFSVDLSQELVKRNVKRLKHPDISIVGPAIESMRYSMDVEEVRSLYIKLIASSVDAETADYVHPSFVQIIKQMSAVDARIFKKLSANMGFVPVANPRISSKNTGMYFVGAVPEWYMSLEDVCPDIFMASSSLVRLSKFGVIDLLFDRTAGKGRCDFVLKSDALKSLLEKLKKARPDVEVELVWTESLLTVNDYGKQFAKVCL